MISKGTKCFIILSIAIILLLIANITVGSIKIPIRDIFDILFSDYHGKESWRFIIMETRLPQAITAMLCGGALSVSGLMLQTAFKNPLAGPSIFGISGGA